MFPWRARYPFSQVLIKLVPNVGRIRTTKNPGSRNSGTSLCPGETHPLKEEPAWVEPPSFPVLLNELGLPHQRNSGPDVFEDC